MKVERILYGKNCGSCIVATILSSPIPLFHGGLNISVEEKIK
jgi:hypothetical protein